MSEKTPEELRADITKLTELNEDLQTKFNDALAKLKEIEDAEKGEVIEAITEKSEVPKDDLEGKSLDE